jgi:hypothetical protein
MSVPTAAPLSHPNEPHLSPDSSPVIARLTPRQRRVLWVGIVLFLLAAIFPPWHEIVNVPYRMHFEKNVGYSFVLSPPAALDPFAAVATVNLDWSRLLLEWIIVAVLAAAGILACPRSASVRSGDSTPESDDSGIGAFPEEEEEEEEEQPVDLRSRLAEMKPFARLTPEEERGVARALDRLREFGLMEPTKESSNRRGTKPSMTGNAGSFEVHPHDTTPLKVAARSLADPRHRLSP